MKHIEDYVPGDQGSDLRSLIVGRWSDQIESFSWSRVIQDVSDALTVTLTGARRIPNKEFICVGRRRYADQLILTFLYSHDNAECLYTITFNA